MNEGENLSSAVRTYYIAVEINNLDLKQLIKKGLAPSETDLDLWKDQLQLMHLLARMNLYDKLPHSAVKW